MKHFCATVALILVSLVGVVNAGGLTPQITLALSHGEQGEIASLEPHLKWKTEGSTGDYDYEAGLDVRVEDFESLPYSIWGKVKRNVMGWGVSARGVIDSTDFNEVDLDVRVKGESTEVQFLGKAGGSNYALNKVNMKQGINAPGGQVILNPSYSIASSKLDVTVGYDADAGFGVKVDANEDDQKLTLSKDLGDRNRIAPSLTRSGVFSVDVERKLDQGSITASLTPSDSVNLKWQDGPWLANLNAPIDGYWIDGINVSVKRKVDI